MTLPLGNAAAALVDKEGHLTPYGVQMLLQACTASPQQVTPGNVAVWGANRSTLEDGGSPAGSGINQLTGDVTAGPGSGSQAATLATVNSNVGTFGDATHVSQVTLDAKGRVTAAANVAITASGTVTHTGTLTSGKLIQGNGGADITANATTAAVTKLTAGTPSAASAGTDYVAPGSITSDGITMNTARLLGRTTASAGAVEEISVSTGLSLSAGVLTATGGSGTVTTTGSPASGNLTKFSGSTSVTNADLTGDVTTSGGVATTLAASGVSAATYGDSTHVPQIAVDAKGRITSASNVAISGGSGALSQLAQIVTSGSQATVDFTSISGSYSSLLVVFMAQSTGISTGSENFRLRINNDSTGSNYSTNAVAGANNGSAYLTGTSANSNGAWIGNIPDTNNTGIPGTGFLVIPTYAGTTFHKMVQTVCGSEQGAGLAGPFVSTSSFRWKSTAAITRLTFIVEGNSFVDGSTLTLYGLQ